MGWSVASSDDAHAYAWLAMSEQQWAVEGHRTSMSSNEPLTNRSSTLLPTPFTRWFSTLALDISREAEDRSSATTSTAGKESLHTCSERNIVMSMSPVPQPATRIRSGRPDPAEWRCNSRPPKSLALSVGRSNDTAMANALAYCEGAV